MSPKKAGTLSVKQAQPRAQAITQRIKQASRLPPPQVRYFRDSSSDRIVAEPAFGGDDDEDRLYMQDLVWGDDSGVVFSPYSSGPSPSDCRTVMTALHDLAKRWMLPNASLEKRANEITGTHLKLTESLCKNGTVDETEFERSSQANLDVSLEVVRRGRFRPEMLKEANRLLVMTHWAREATNNTEDGLQTERAEPQGSSNDFNVARTLGEIIGDCLPTAVEKLGFRQVAQALKATSMEPKKHEPEVDLSSLWRRRSHCAFSATPGGRVALVGSTVYRDVGIDYWNDAYVTKGSSSLSGLKDYYPNCEGFMLIDSKEGVLSELVKAASAYFNVFDGKRKELLYQLTSARDKQDDSAAQLAAFELNLSDLHGEFMSDELVDQIENHTSKANKLFDALEREHGDYTPQERSAYFAIRDKFRAVLSRDKEIMYSLAAHMISVRDPDPHIAKLLRKATEASKKMKVLEAKSAKSWEEATSGQSAPPRSIRGLRNQVESRRKKKAQASASPATRKGKSLTFEEAFPEYSVQTESATRKGKSAGSSGRTSKWAADTAIPSKLKVFGTADDPEDPGRHLSKPPAAHAISQGDVEAPKQEADGIDHVGAVPDEGDAGLSAHQIDDGDDKESHQHGNEESDDDSADEDGMSQNAVPGQLPPWRLFDDVDVSRYPVNTVPDSEFERLHIHGLSQYASAEWNLAPSDPGAETSELFPLGTVSYMQHAGYVQPLPRTADGRARLESVYVNTMTIIGPRPTDTEAPPVPSGDLRERSSWAQARPFIPQAQRDNEDAGASEQ